MPSGMRVKTVRTIWALPRHVNACLGQALHYIFFYHIWQQKKDAVSILNAIIY